MRAGPRKRELIGSENDMDLLSTSFGFQEKVLNLQSKRLQILASNIANADTPNFKSQELDFKAVLKELRDKMKGGKKEE